MPAENQEPVSTQALGDPRQHQSLARLIEVGERQIAAENELERAGGLRHANVLPCELDARFPLMAKAEQAATALKRAFNPLRWKLLEAAFRIARHARTCEESFVRVGSNNREIRSGEPEPDALLPDETQRVRLLSRGASSTPAPDHRLDTPGCCRRELWQDCLSEAVEDSSVTAKARNRNPAARVQYGPFARVVAQVADIRILSAQSKLADPPFYPLAHLTTNAAETSPAQAQVGQCPLQ